MSLFRLLEDRAREHGGKSLILCDEQVHSYADVHRSASRAAAQLAIRGIRKGDKIILLMGNCVEFVYLFLGAGRIGAVLVPINPLLKPDEIAYIVDNSDAETLVVTGECAPLLPILRPLIPRVRRYFVLDGEVTGTEPFAGLLEEPGATPPMEEADRSDAAALIYTSGTTGQSKGAILTHGNYLSNALMISHVAGLCASDRFFCVLPLFHVNAQVVTVLTPLTLGADILLMKKFNPFSILPLIERHRATVLSGVPTIYNVMCRMQESNPFDISSIRMFACGAAPLPEETYLEIQRVLKRPLITGYGLTEATCASAVSDARDPVKWDAVGSPLMYTSIRIVDEAGVDTRYGAVGQILIGGPSVMKGYYKNPEATKEVLRDGWLCTGDLGRFDEDGYLYIMGRIKDMIIRGGQNIYPQQVEDVISRMPGVQEVCVVGVEEKRWGQEVLAVIQLADGHALTEDQVIDYCHEHIAAYKCPRFVRFLNPLPKTATGKIRKVEIAAQFADIACG